jgi:tape measure domain-containing protein
VATEDVRLQILADISRLLADFDKLEGEWTDTTGRIETEGESAFRDVQRVVENFIASVKRLTGATDEEEEEWRSMILTLDKVEAEYSGLNSTIRRTSEEQNRQKDTTEKTNTSMKRLGKSLRSVARSMKLFIAAFAANQLRRLASDAIEVAAAFDSIDARLLAVFGSQKAANQEFQFVNDIATKLGFSLRQTATDYSKLAAAAEGSRLEGEGVRDLFLGAAQAARVMGLNTQSASAIFTALEQIMSRGVVAAEEVRRQMGNQLPKAFIIASRAMDMTTAEFDKLLRTGTLLAEDFLPRLGQQLQKEFGEAAEDASTRFAASQGRIQVAVEKLQAAFALGLAPAARDLSKILTEASQENAGAVRFSKMLGQFAGAAAEAAVDFLDFAGDLGRFETQVTETADQTQFFLETFQRFNELRGIQATFIDPLTVSLENLGESADTAADGLAEAERRAALMKRTMEQLNDPLGDVVLSLKALGLASEEELGDAVDQIRKYEEAIRDSGDVTVEQAELIVSKTEDILTKIRFKRRPRQSRRRPPNLQLSGTQHLKAGKGFLPSGKR